jgi:hypothetical protein
VDRDELRRARVEHEEFLRMLGVTALTVLQGRRYDPAHPDALVRKFDPSQPRNPHSGEWIDTTPGDGGRGFAARLAAAVQGADVLDSVSASLADGRGLTSGQKSALRQYMNAGAHDRINSALREGKGGKFAQVAQIDEAMSGSRLSRDVVVFRGVPAQHVFGPKASRLDDLSGFEWEDPAFVSTSARKERASGFGGDDQIVLRILVPKGTSAVGVSPYSKKSGATDEAELLLDRGLRMRVVADRVELGDPNPFGDRISTRVLDVEVVG